MRMYSQEANAFGTSLYKETGGRDDEEILAQLYHTEIVVDINYEG